MADALLEAQCSGGLEELLDTPEYRRSATAVYSYKQVAFHFQHELTQELCIRDTSSIAILGHALIVTSEKRPSEYLPFRK